MIINVNSQQLISAMDTERAELLSNVATLLAETSDDGRLSSGDRIIINRNASALGRLDTGDLLGNVFDPGNLGTIIQYNETQEFSLGTASRPWGAIYAQNGVIQTSDANRKRLIKESNLGLSFVMSLKPVSYAWRNSVSTVPNFGFLGHEVEEALGGRKFGGLNKSDEGYSLRYVDFIAPMVKAMQQQQQQIDSLKREIQLLRDSLSKQG